MTHRVSTAIIGGGVLGLAVAYYLLMNGKKNVVLLEKNNAFGLEQSGSNSGVIHSGFIYKPGTSMADLCVEGVELLKGFCRERSVPYNLTGKLVVATETAQEKELEFYYKQARKNGLEGVKLISRKEAEKLEPCVAAKAGLYIQNAGIFDPAYFVSELYRQISIMHDTPDLIMRGCKVIDITPLENCFLLDVHQTNSDIPRWQIECESLVNAAGLYSLDVAKLIDPDMNYRKQLLKGEYYQFNCRSDLFVNRNVYPVPVMVDLPTGGQFLDLGAHLTPKVGPGRNGQTIVAREILVGPIFSEVNDPEDISSSLEPDIFYDAVKGYFPKLKIEDLYKGHTGILGLVKGKTDFMILKDEKYPQCTHLLGMESPALTASLAIGKNVVNLTLGQ